MPIYTIDPISKDAQIEVVDLTVGAPNPLLATIPLTGTIHASRVSRLPTTQVIKPQPVEAVLGSPNKGFVGIYEISTVKPWPILHEVLLGLTWNPSSTVGGGMLKEDYAHNRAFVAGDDSLGILDTSQSPPVWDQSSVVNWPGYCTDSLALKFQDRYTLRFLRRVQCVIIDTSKSWTYAGSITLRK